MATTGARRSAAPRNRTAGKISQSEILRQLGVKDPTSPAFVNQISSNGRLQQYFNTRANLKGLPEPFNPSLASTIIQDILPLAAIADAAAGAASGAASGAADTVGASSAVGARTALKGAALYGVASASIGSSLDFLKLIAWIFHPRNILRAVEFVVGIILMIFGLHAAMQARGERVEGFSTSEGALTRSGLGRVATELGRAARAPSGSRQVQRPRSAPHKTRQKALAQRYKREEDLQRRRAKAPRPKKKP